ncbi:MAG: class I SAM-dependent methyltransferase [Actinomycetota bacterium]|nr:class I SAM-dependent methyltransferase [Actinomycetota bacterium]
MASIDSSFLAQLTIGREFYAPAVERAVASLNLAAGARVLDAGTGGGGAIPPLARAVGATGSVLAVDRDPTLAALASDYAKEAENADRVTVQVGDIIKVLADASTAPENSFDAIWAADVVYPVYFAEPADVIRQMAQALRPGGIIALFYPKHNYATFLPGYPLLEHGLLTASEISWGAPVDGPRHRERHLSWLLDADLEDVSLKVFPQAYFPVGTNSTARQFLELGVWPILRENAVNFGAEAGLSTEDVDKVQRLLTPGDPHYVLDEPGYFIVLPATLSTGKRPENS